MNVITATAPYDWQAVLTLLHKAFAYIEPRINPPSSLHRLTTQQIETHATHHSLLAIEQAHTPIACLFLTFQSDHLYLGKLATHPDHTGQGHARRLIAKAEQIAQEQALPCLRLETRIELTENHATFARLGFVKTVENTHAGFSRPTSITMEKPL
nr:GNAT family N-acetyltransferase [Amylibacter sp.]